MAQTEGMFMGFIPYTGLSAFILILSLFKKNFFFWYTCISLPEMYFFPI